MRFVDFRGSIVESFSGLLPLKFAVVAIGLEGDLLWFHIGIIIALQLRNLIKATVNSFSVTN